MSNAILLNSRNQKPNPTVSSIYIETTCAWYILREPSEEYRALYYDRFLFAQIIANHIITSIDATDKKDQSWGAAEARILDSYHPSGRFFTKQDIKDSVRK